MNHETNSRRELLSKGLGHGTVEFLRFVWFPVVGNLRHLLPEWEVRDFSNGYRYLDLAYMPAGAKALGQDHDKGIMNVHSSHIKSACRIVSAIISSAVCPEVSNLVPCPAHNDIYSGLLWRLAAFLISRVTVF